MFTKVKLAKTPARVKPESAWQRGNQLRRVESQRGQAAHEATRAATSTIPTARCGPACRVVWKGTDQRWSAPIPIPGRAHRVISGSASLSFLAPAGSFATIEQ